MGTRSVDGQRGVTAPQGPQGHTHAPRRRSAKLGISRNWGTRVPVSAPQGHTHAPRRRSAKLGILAKLGHACHRFRPAPWMRVPVSAPAPRRRSANWGFSRNWGTRRRLRPRSPFRPPFPPAPQGPQGHTHAPRRRSAKLGILAKLGHACHRFRPAPWMRVPVSARNGVSADVGP